MFMSPSWLLILIMKEADAFFINKGEIYGLFDRVIDGIQRISFD